MVGYGLGSPQVGAWINAIRCDCSSKLFKILGCHQEVLIKLFENFFVELSSSFHLILGIRSVGDDSFSPASLFSARVDLQ